MTSDDLVRSAVDVAWQECLPAFTELVGIPAVSPSFDPGWRARGEIVRIVTATAGWFRSRPLAPQVTVSDLPERTPSLLVEVPGSASTAPTVLFYGHLDKQPAGAGWRVTDPWIPVVRDGRMFGRGAADDVYAAFTAWNAIEAAHADAITELPRCLILLESSEESSSVDLPAHLDALSDRVGQPDLVVCLDGFVPDDRRVWRISSLRGIIVADMTIRVLSQAVHSGEVGGIVRSPFHILRRLLDRIENPDTAEVLLPGLRTPHPEGLARIIEEMVIAGVGSPVDGVGVVHELRPFRSDVAEQLTVRAWEPSISYVGIDGMPPTSSAASVVLPEITVRLSIRIPPDADPDAAASTLVSALTANEANAAVDVSVIAAESGFVAPALSSTLFEALNRASCDYFGGESLEVASGVTVPFMGMLKDRYPRAQVLNLGVLTPESHPHSADESLDLAAAASLSAALARVLREGFTRS